MLELVIAGVLILLNGVFALSELAIVSAKRNRLKALADEGRRGARVALHLSEEPGRFLSTVQIGITLVGILAGAVSGAALSERFDEVLLEWGVPLRFAGPLAYVIVIGAITYLSVVVGELVPKHVALRDPERIAILLAPPMALLSRLAAPVVWLLDASTRGVFRLFGTSAGAESSVTEHDLRSVVEEAETAGVIETDEKKMISGVLRLGDRAVRGVMTPRREVDWIDVAAPEEAIRERLLSSTHSRLPAGDGDADNMIGVIEVRDLLGPFLGGKTVDYRALVKAAPVVPDTQEALDTLAVLQEAAVPMALIHDEYGHFEGLVTPADIIDAIAGAFRSDEGADEPEAVQRADGSWLVAGWMPADEMAELLGIVLPAARSYETVAGLVIGELQHLPDTGETVEAFGWRFEVVDLDGRRVDKVIASRVAPAAAPATEAPAGDDPSI